MASAVIDVTTENKQISSMSSQDYDVLSNNSASMDNSLVQSPSIDSFSTFQETENLSELNMDENMDLCVKIDNPQKHLDTLETYITFRLTTKVARIEFSENEYIVRRRYNDFIWLRQKLVESYPTHIVPPLPGKHSLIGQLDRYSKDFILARMKLLNIFMARLVEHPILSCNEYFKVFLTAKQTEFTSYRKSQRNSIGKLPESFQTISAMSNVKSRMIEFEKSRDYLHTLSEKLIMIEKISNRINKERQDYIIELNNFYPVLSWWSTSEPHLAPLLQSMANAVERTSAAQNDMVQQHNSVVTSPVREFMMYIDVVKDVLNKRDNYQILYENSVEELMKKRTEKESLILACHNAVPTNANHFSIWRQQTSDQKLEKLGIHIPQLIKQAESYQDRLECANEALRSDIARWHLEKQACLKKILVDFATKQIEYYEKAVAAWEKVANECTC
ncbi:Sorting nexin 1 [Carabus blaptoides fortunei]